MNREQTFLVLLLALTGVASFLVLLPFVQYVLGALILGYVLRPLHCRLAPRLGQKPAAFTVIAGAAVALDAVDGLLDVLPLPDVRLEVVVDVPHVVLDLPEGTQTVLFEGAPRVGAQLQ